MSTYLLTKSLADSLYSRGSRGCSGASSVSLSSPESSLACSPASSSMDSPYPASLFSMSLDDPFFILFRGTGILWGDLSSNSNISTSASLHNW